MLWKKESTLTNAHYVDIFAQSGNLSVLNRAFGHFQSAVDFSELRKNNAISLQKRMTGNLVFGKQQWYHAMLLYNESLCYAEKGSENISLAYANRASCFMKMKLYNESLKDIELAKEADYPAHLMPKLDQREADCLKGVQKDGRTIDHVAKLSFEPDEKFPCMANALGIVRNVDGNYTVVAKRDIDVGQTIVVEETLKCICSGHEMRCSICLKAKVNLIPCGKCSVAMFCSAECQASIFHEYECGVKFSKDNQFNGTTMKNIRGILRAIHLFPNIDELMGFVERTIQSELPDTLIDEQTRYRALLKLRTSPSISNAELAAVAFPNFKLLLKHPKINVMFQSKKHRRFLMHLVAQHVLINLHHTANLQLLVSTNESFGQVCQYSALGVMQQYFQHSCGPNAVRIFDGTANLVYVLVRPVKKGEEVFISYLPFDRNGSTTEQRQKMLREKKGFVCECLRCINIEVSAATRNRISLNADFRSVLSLGDYVRRSDDVTKYPELIEKCVAVLQRFGQIDWCPEIEKVILTFTKAYRMQYDH